jgi:hypothetical protein
MLTPAFWLQLLWVIVVIEALLLIVVLRVRRLHRIYRYFNLYLIYQVAVAVLLMAVKRGTNSYALIWMCSKPLDWLLSLLMASELFLHTMMNYPGLQTVLKRMVLAAATIGVMVSSLVLFLDFRSPHERFPLLRVALARQRAFDTTIGLCVLIPLLLSVAFRLRLNRNTYLHCLVLSVYLNGAAAQLLLRNLAGHSYATVISIGGLVVTNCCFLAWLLFLDGAGEKNATLFPATDPRTEGGLLHRLDRLNELLLRLAR